ncbi:MAG: sigma-70 family RNA polymerase sigma factor [Atopobiaceae bacterium]|nr:sigma-70 family RNA polymerase sigma factor [Atopobiaceae bacterium]
MGEIRLHNRASYLVDTYADTILRLSYSYLQSTADAEDITQDILLKLLTAHTEFVSQEHEKAWIIRSTINACKDLLKSARYSRVQALDERLELVDETAEFDTAQFDVLAAVESLPSTYRSSIYLRYYEGYSSKEIATLTRQSVTAVDKQISRGRKILKHQLEGEYA